MTQKLPLPQQQSNQRTKLKLGIGLNLLWGTPILCLKSPITSFAILPEGAQILPKNSSKNSSWYYNLS